MSVSSDDVTPAAVKAALDSLPERVGQAVVAALAAEREAAVAVVPPPADAQATLADTPPKQSHWFYGDQ